MSGEEQGPEGQAFNIERQTQPITIERTGDEFRSYANHVGITLTAEEVALTFALRNPEEANAEAVSIIYLSLPHMKRLARVLANSVEQYEQVFGTITEDAADQILPEVREKFGF